MISAHVLDVPEFRPMVGTSRDGNGVTVSGPVKGYRTIEAPPELTFDRKAMKMKPADRGRDEVRLFGTNRPLSAGHGRRLVAGELYRTVPRMPPRFVPGRASPSFSSSGNCRSWTMLRAGILRNAGRRPGPAEHRRPDRQRCARVEPADLVAIARAELMDRRALA